MSRYKKKVVIFAICLSVFFTSSFGIYFDRTRDVYAFDLVITPTVLYYVVGSFLIASSVVVAQQNDLWNIAQQAFDDLKSKTTEEQSKIIYFEDIKNPKPDGPKGFWKLGAMGFGWLGQLIEGFKSNNSISNSNEYVEVLQSFSFDLRKGNYPNIYFASPGGSVIVDKVHNGEIVLEYIEKIYVGNEVGDPSDPWFYVKRFGADPSGYFRADRNIKIDIIGGKMIQPPSSVVENYNEPSVVPPLAIPVAPNGNIVLNPDDMVGKDWLQIEDLVTNGEVSPDPGLDPNPDPGPDPGLDPNPDPGTGGVGDLDTNIPNDIKLDFSPLYVSFAQKFPFCIPFDLVNSIRSFSVSRETPKFNVFFDETVFLGGGSFTIDFSKFSVIAAILRYFILLSFLVSLVKVTRDLIKG